MKPIFKTMTCATLVVMLFSCTQKSKNTLMDTTTDNGLIIKNSSLDFETTYTTLRNIINGNPNLNIMLELDHSKNAISKGLELRPTRIIIFGNPALGTPLMNNKATLSIDLPQKIVVYQLEDGTVQIAYNDPNYLSKRHSLVGQEVILAKISKALDVITEKAIRK